jgi:hypothetical protein
MKKIVLTIILLLGLTACSSPPPTVRAVYVLLDTSGTYTQELEKANQIISFLLSRLNSGETLAVARIDSASFSEKDLIARVTFSDRPSRANDEKRKFKLVFDDFVKNVESSQFTDISGALLQASEFLNETDANKKTIFIFSDLEQELPKGQKRDFTIPLNGINVVALNVTKLRKDNIDPRHYLDRLADWQTQVINGGGEWTVINDLDNIKKLID